MAENKQNRALSHRAAWILLPLLSLAVYLPGLSYPFVYDDHGAIAENPFLSQPDAWRRVLTLDTLDDPDVIDGQRPAVIATYLLDRGLWGLRPAGWRATSLLLHGLTLVLFAALLARLMTPGGTAAPPSAGSCSGLRSEQAAREAAGPPGTRHPSGPGGKAAPPSAGFLVLAVGLHPLLIETVHSPAFREDLLSLVGVLGFLLAGLRTAERGSWPCAVLALLSFAFALLSKESALVAPALLLVLLPVAMPTRRVVWIRATALAVAALAGIAWLAWHGYADRPVQAAGVLWNGRSLRLPDNLLTAPALFAGYLGKLVLPVNLSIDYTVTPVTDLADPRLWIGLGAVSLAVAGALGWLPLPALARTGLAWILLWFVPVSNLVPLFNPVADRYAHGMVFGAGLFLAGIVARQPSRRWILPCLFAAGWGGLTVHRLSDWRSDEAIWSSALTVNPRSDRAHTWLGLLAADAGRTDEARIHYRTATDINPHDPIAAINLAVLEGRAGNLDEAEQLLREVLARVPDHVTARANLDYLLELRASAR